jgi:CRP-like cAMP-binding protein
MRALGDILIPHGTEASARLMNSVRDSIVCRSMPIARVHLSEGERLRKFDKDENRIYLVENGAVSLEHFSPAGRRTILDVLPPNCLFGEDSLPGQSDQYTPTACVPTRLLSLRNDAFQAIVQDAAVNAHWQMVLMLKARRNRSFLLQNAISDCEARLAMRLFDMAWCFGTKDGREIRIELRLRHEDYAAMIGTTRSRVGFFLQRFAGRNMLRKSEAGLLVVDPPMVVGYIMERMGLTPASPAGWSDR